MVKYTKNLKLIKPITMNREIKFRAWDGHEMHYNVNYLHNYGAIKYGCHSTAWTDTAKAGEIMQYTGLKDRNGKEIYEGDIVSTPGGIAKVIFDNGCFYIYTKGKGRYRLGGYDSNNVKIVGNIYENPELLEQ